MVAQVHSTNYVDTFIRVADDSPAEHGTIPPSRTVVPTVASIQYELISGAPYRYTSDDVLFLTHARRLGIADADAEEERARFFSRGQACLRSSPLAKRYGWGVHSDRQGRVALYGVESSEYAELSANASVRQTNAMRSSRRPR